MGKKDGLLHLCIDYSGLINITIKNALPLLSSAFEPLHGVNIFTKLDLWNAYHIIRIWKGDKWETTLNTPLGHFEYLVIPFGFLITLIALKVFQVLVNDILQDFINQCAFIELDDILIFFCNPQEHHLHVFQILQCLLEGKPLVKAEKCEFLVPSVTFISDITEGGKVKADLVKAVTEWPTSTSRKCLHQFLGFLKGLWISSRVCSGPISLHHLHE